MISTALSLERAAEKFHETWVSIYLQWFQCKVSIAFLEKNSASTFCFLSRLKLTESQRAFPSVQPSETQYFVQIAKKSVEEALTNFSNRLDDLKFVSRLDSCVQQPPMSSYIYDTSVVSTQKPQKGNVKIWVAEAGNKLFVIVIYWSLAVFPIVL